MKERYKTMRELKEIIAEMKEVEKRVIYLNSCYDLDSWDRGELMSKEKQLANLWEELEKRVDKQSTLCILCIEVKQRITNEIENNLKKLQKKY